MNIHVYIFSNIHFYLHIFTCTLFISIVNLSVYRLDVLLVVVLYMYIPLFILAQFTALESTMAISLKSADLMLQSFLFDTGSGAGGVPG